MISKLRAEALSLSCVLLLTACAANRGPEFGLPPIPKENAGRFEPHYSTASAEQLELKARGSRLGSTLSFDVTVSNEGSDPLSLCRSCVQLFIDEVESGSDLVLRAGKERGREIGPKQETVPVPERSTTMLTLVFKRTSVAALEQEGVARLHLALIDASGRKQEFDFRFRLFAVKGTTPVSY